MDDDKRQFLQNRAEREISMEVKGDAAREVEVIHDSRIAFRLMFDLQEIQREIEAQVAREMEEAEWEEEATAEFENPSTPEFGILRTPPSWAGES